MGGRGADTIGTVTEVDRVEVPLEDLFLRERLLEAERKSGFGELAFNAHLRRQDDVLDILLGDRRGARNDASRVQIVHDCPRECAEVDTGMRPEPFVFDPDDSIDQGGWKLVVGDESPVLLGVPLGEHTPVGGVHDRRETASAKPGVIDGLDRARRDSEGESDEEWQPASHEFGTRQRDEPLTTRVPTAPCNSGIWGWSTRLRTCSTDSFEGPSGS